MLPVRILVVDDSPLLQAATARVLSADARVQIVGLAPSGRAALDEADRLRPDLVLMDWAMPEMDGLEATRRLKKRPDAPRVLLLSAHDGDEYQAAAAAHADGFLPKTALGTHLLPLIHTLFKKSG